jgi:hypothetical protein
MRERDRRHEVDCTPCRLQQEKQTSGSWLSHAQWLSSVERREMKLTAKSSQRGWLAMVCIFPLAI